MLRLAAMDKGFFDQFDQRKKDFASRAGLGDEVRAELILGNGRIFVVTDLVEVSDGWLHADGYDADDETNLKSLVLPYYQINHVLFMRPRPKSQAGFSR